MFLMCNILVSLGVVNWVHPVYFMTVTERTHESSRDDLLPVSNDEMRRSGIRQFIHPSASFSNYALIIDEYRGYHIRLYHLVIG